MTEWVRKALPYLLLAPAFLPLVYVSGFLYPYVVPKTFLFRGLGIMVLASLIFLALSGAPLFWARLKQKITWIPAALLFVAYTTSLLGVDFYHSFWSIYDRGDGLLTLTAACIFFYGVVLSADGNFLTRLFKVSAWVASVVALYAVLQWLQSVTGMNIPLVTDPRGRIGATFGNAAFLAAYLGMTLFATLAVVREYRGNWKRMIYIGAVLQLTAIILAATRGTLLALLVCGFAAALYLARKGEGRARSYARAGLLAAIIVGGVFFAFRASLAHVPFAPIQRIASISLSDPTVSSRLFIWNNALSEGLKKPLTGYGAEHVDVLFDRFYDPTLILEEWFDRTHNAFLDYFVQYGILGVALYALLIAALCSLGITLLRRKDRYGAFLFLLGGVYAIQNFFVFATALTLWFLFAITAALLAYINTEKSGVVRASVPRTASLVAVAGILLLLYPVVIQPMRANLYLASGYRDHVTDVHRAVASFEKGLSLNTYADIEYGYQAYSMYTDHQVGMLSGEDRVFAYRFALTTLSNNMTRYPYDARTATYLAHVLDLAPAGVGVDEGLMRGIVGHATELSPKRLQPWYILANISLKKGDKAATFAEKSRWYREAIGILEQYTQQVPRSVEPRYVIANIYLSLNDRVSAKKWADEALPLYTHLHLDTARKAFRYYVAVENWANAERFMKDVLGEEPDNYPLLYDFAKVRFLQGDRDEALAIVERLRTVAPDLVATDPTFLKAVGQ